VNSALAAQERLMSEVTPHAVMEKYEFYFLALTFTLLGLSIQTVDFESYSNINTIIELLGWLLFGVSGVVGLSKIEYLPSIITIRNERDAASSYVSELQKIK
jgi:NhaP-type Na+/H+ or K+/H+ antiporter